MHLFPAILRALSAHQTDVGDTPSLSQAEDAIAELRLDHDFFMHELASAIRTTRRLLKSSGLHVGVEELKDVRATIDAVGRR
ncbi:MAG: hypothetical protein ACMG6H_02055, partial [Acidobacteriota bacterium]